LLAHKLKELLTASEMAMVMICVKLSRQVHRPKRDNMTDAAGYAWVAQECVDETERRNAAEAFSVLPLKVAEDASFRICSFSGGALAPQPYCDCQECSTERLAIQTRV
jgi:Domain of unknown function (DUF6378)